MISYNYIYPSHDLCVFHFYIIFVYMVSGTYSFQGYPFTYVVSPVSIQYAAKLPPYTQPQSMTI